MAHLPPITTSSPTVQVSELPAPHGKGKDTSEKTFGSFDQEAHWGSLNGAISVSVAPQDLNGPTSNVTLDVGQGRVRLYLQDGKGYRYIEATPGNPAQTRGDLMYAGGSWWYTLEAVDGEAKGITAHVWRRNK